LAEVKENEMGYSTDFKGELRFVSEPSTKQLAALSAMFGEDCRDHPEWNAPELYYVDLELTEDFGGIRWNGAEKTDALEKIVNVVITEMRKQWPEFSLVGQMVAQGERFEDRWVLSVGLNGIAEKVATAITGEVVECPHCGKRFALEGDTD
jgi:hypothetical protein